METLLDAAYGAASLFVGSPLPTLPIRHTSSLDCPHRAQDPLNLLDEECGSCWTVYEYDQRTPHTIGGLLRRYLTEFLREFPHELEDYQLRVLQKLAACRRGASLGFHAYACQHCGQRAVVPNGCNNRYCAGCGGRRGRQWLEKRLSWYLPIVYLHVVFTLPHEFNPLFHANWAVLVRLFFTCVINTLKTIARQYYGCEIGITAVLHTWGQRGLPHIHIHVVATGGGPSLDGNAVVLDRAGR